MPLTLLMASHGQTDLNIDERWQGRLDPPLNATGLAQAAALAATLPARIDAIVTSPMQRAIQTARAVADAACRRDSAPIGAEPTRTVVDRVAQGLAALHACHAGRPVLLVSHGFVVRRLRHLIDGLDESDFFTAGRIPNGSFLGRQPG